MKLPSLGFKSLLLVAVLAGVASACQMGAASWAGTASRALKPAGRQGGGVSSHIVLRSATLVSGRSEHGTLVIANRTGRAIRWGCAYLEVQLTNAQWPLYAHPTPCGATRALAVGTTRLPFTLRATHASKPLPPGTYHTQLLAPPKFVHPHPISVHVVGR